MLSYSDIVKKAYSTTISYPTLWLFGLFVVGGFNLNFLNYENIPLKHLVLQRHFFEIALFFQRHPGFLALASASVLFFSLFSLIVTNWSRIMLVLLGGSVLESKQAQVEEQFKKSKQPLWPVIKISLLTTGLILIVASALFLPPLFLEMDQSLRMLLLEAGALIFLPLAFAVSCINIFTVFYLVWYKKPLLTALNLGTDFFLSRWTQILGLVIVLMVIYFASFVLGISLIFLTKLALRLALLAFLRFNIFSLSAIMIMLKVVSNLLLWFLLAGLSVFFNQALLILFFELNQPVKSEELGIERKPVPVPTT